MHKVAPVNLFRFASCPIIGLVHSQEISTQNVPLYNSQVKVVFSFADERISLILWIASLYYENSGFHPQTVRNRTLRNSLN